MRKSIILKEKEENLDIKNDLEDVSDYEEVEYDQTREERD